MFSRSATANSRVLATARRSHLRGLSVMAHAPSINPPSQEQAHNLVTLSVPIGRRCCAACAELVERRLRENPHVKSVRVDAFAGIARVASDEGSVSIQELQQIAGEC